jgi:hypothetical protein
VTNLALHPSHPTLLLSSSTDGLVNIFDTSQADEDDALYQVVNHGSAIAHAGFMYPGTDIYAIGTDETVSFFALQSQKEEEEEPTPKVWGDVREGLGCEYVVDLAWVGQQACVAAGKHRYVHCSSHLPKYIRMLTVYSESRLNLIPINKGINGPLDYSFDLENSMSFPGAHGEEIVRDLFTDTHVGRLSSFQDDTPTDTLDRRTPRTHAAKTVKYVHGSPQKKAVWRLMKERDQRRRGAKRRRKRLDSSHTKGFLVCSCNHIGLPSIPAIANAHVLWNTRRRKARDNRDLPTSVLCEQARITLLNT